MRFSDPDDVSCFEDCSIDPFVVDVGSIGAPQIAEQKIAILRVDCEMLAG
jgi:hypothetical protein